MKRSLETWLGALVLGILLHLGAGQALAYESWLKFTPNSQFCIYLTTTTPTSAAVEQQSATVVGPGGSDTVDVVVEQITQGGQIITPPRLGKGALNTTETSIGYGATIFPSPTFPSSTEWGANLNPETGTGSGIGIAITPGGSAPIQATSVVATIEKGECSNCAVVPANVTTECKTGFACLLANEDCKTEKREPGHCKLSIDKAKDCSCVCAPD